MMFSYNIQLFLEDSHLNFSAPKEIVSITYKIQLTSPFKVLKSPERYRETHDLVHAVLNMPTDMVGETLVKWVEALQTGLPMCIGGAVLGPGRFSRNAQFIRFRKLRPWAIQVGQSSDFLLNVYFEQRWEQDIDDLRDELKIPPVPS